MDESSEFKPSASLPILSIIRHFNLPEIPAYCLANILLLQDVTDQMEFDSVEYHDLMRKVFVNIEYPEERKIMHMLENEIRKQRNL